MEVGIRMNCSCLEEGLSRTEAEELKIFEEETTSR